MPEDAIDKTLTWSSSNENVATVDDIGNVTAVGEGVALITVTANDGSGVTANCNITVTPPPPPSAGVGAETHEAKEIIYTWEELNEIAKVISNNYGEEAGKVNNDTVEVNVSINGKSDTLGIGDWTTLEDDNGREYEVRILGFNHDDLVKEKVNENGETYAINQYGSGTSNEKAGISFKFVTLMSLRRMNGSRNNSGGWGASELRDYLNSQAVETFNNKEYIKEVRKEYIKIYNNPESINISEDKLWILSTAEVWGSNQKAITEEGVQYKFYEVLGVVGNESMDQWCRSPVGSNYMSFCVIKGGGAACTTGVADAGYYCLPSFSI